MVSRRALLVAGLSSPLATMASPRTAFCWPTLPHAIFADPTRWPLLSDVCRVDPKGDAPYIQRVAALSDLRKDSW